MLNLYPCTCFSFLYLMTKLIPFTATTHILRSKEENLWPGIYTVNLVVKDNGGKSSEIQKLQLTVCTCRENTNKPTCQSARQSRNGTVLGAGGALTLLIGILLLVGKYHHLSTFYILYCSTHFVYRIKIMH